MEYPLVSIITLTWNHEQYIRQSIESAFEQNYPNKELIILDNQSTDSTFSIIQDTIKNAPIPVTVHQFDHNVGIPSALNFAIKNLAKGEWICLNSGDDWMDPSNVLEKINYHLAHPEYEWIYSYGYHFFEDTKTTEEVDRTIFKEGNVFDELLEKNFIYLHGALINKKVYAFTNYYDTGISIEDWDFALKAASKFPIGLVKKPLFYYRRHSKSYSNSLSVRYYADCIRLLTKYKSNPKAKESLRKYIPLFLWKSGIEKRNWNTVFQLIRYSYLDYKNLFLAGRIGLERLGLLKPPTVNN